MSERLLDAHTIERYLKEVAEELSKDGPQQTVIMVGGALLAWHGLRDATRDVDTVQRLTRELVTAITRVAGRHDLAPKWLNDSAAGFLPATFEINECELLMETPTLQVFGAPWDQLLLMKLYASRAVDTADLRVIWPNCSFETTEEAVEAFNLAYPNEDPDEYLADHLCNIL